MFILTVTFKQSITCSANALIMYSLAKDVEGGGERILHIVDSIWIKLPYQLLGFPKTCVVFCVESLIVLRCGYVLSTLKQNLKWKLFFSISFFLT